MCKRMSSKFGASLIAVRTLMLLKPEQEQEMDPAACSPEIEEDSNAIDDCVINNEEDATENVYLAASMMAECEAMLSPSNLNTAVFLFRQALDDLPTTHLLRTDAMSNLASALCVRYMYTNQIGDLMESLTLRRKLVDDLGPPQDASNNAKISVGQDIDADTADILKSAKDLLMDFRKSTTLDVLNTVVFLVQQALPHLLLSPPIRTVAFVTLIDGLYARFNHCNDMAAGDITKAISTLEDAIKSCTEQNEQYFVMNCRMCGLLAAQYDITNDFSNLGNVQTRLASLQNAIIKGTQTPVSVLQQLQLGINLGKTFTESGDMSALNTAVTLFRGVIQELSQESPDYSVVVNNLGLALWTRSIHNGQQTDLDEAISLHRQALELRLAPHPSRSDSLNNLANALTTRFEHRGEQSDLDESISLHRQALDLRLPPHPNRSSSLSNLAAALLRKFEQGGLQNDLDEAILLHREALKLRPSPHPDRSGSLDNLAGVLWTRYKQEGHQTDLDEAISLHRQALELRLWPHPHRSSSLNNLAVALQTRFWHGGQRNDLDETISLYRQCVDLRPLPHPLRPGSLSNLASALQVRFEQGGEENDLNEAISLCRLCLELETQNHPRRFSSINNLALALMTKFEYRGQYSDLDEAISLLRQTLEVRLPSDPNQPISFTNLAAALRTRFHQGGDKSVLNEAISLNSQALELRPPPHPLRSESLSNLALVLSTRFQTEGQQSDLDKAMSLFSSATQYLFQPPSRRLLIAQIWIDHADQHQHNSAINAYDAALHTLPQVAALSLDVQSRQKALTASSDGLARNASRCAIRYGNIEKAVEFLEAGRSIFWSQVLSLRSPFDQLRNVTDGGPALADRLQYIANKLEIGSHRDVSAEILDNRKRLTIDQEASQLNRLNEEWTATILEVRKLAGFEDFLNPPRLSSLQLAASNHPVVLLVANDDESNCLIMTLTTIHHIPLPNLRTSILKVLVDNIRMAVSQSPISRSFIDESRQTINKLLGKGRGISYQSDSEGSDVIFKFVLKMLWDELVKPVIDLLDIKKSDEMTVLQWCPTGYFTFLPIHAAGCYDDDRAIDCAPDYFISSYTPTIGTLLAEPSAPSPNKFQMMAVIESQELPSTKEELKKIQQYLPSDALVEFGVPGSPARVEEVASRLPAVSIVHFACHAKQHPFKPLDSGLKLDDGRLTISRIMREQMPNGSLAFLCACETAMGDETLPDEAMSLGASLLFSGFQKVVATMWQMMDRDGPTIADTFYRQLFRGPDGKQALEPDVTKSAYALHIAVQELRSQLVPFRRWVPFIHMGK